MGAKGGAGTTTLVVNVAAALASMGKSVIAIELTPECGSFAPLLNHTPSWDISTLLRGASESISRDSVASCLEELEAGFRVLCGPQRAEDWRTVSPQHARALLEAARGLADYTLIDVPSTFTPSLEELIQRSSFTALVLERNRISLHAALAKMPALQAMAARPGVVGAVLVNKTPFVEFLTPSEFGRRLDCEIIGVVPPAADLLAAGEAEVLLSLSRPESPFSEIIQGVARRLHAGPGRFRAA
jgi:pilus assembly protein CpaE